jgi:hypothetical protein
VGETQEMVRRKLPLELGVVQRVCCRRRRFSYFSTGIARTRLTPRQHNEMRGREGAAELGRVAELRPCRTPAPWRVHSASTSLRCVLGDVPEHGTSRSQYRTARPTRPGAVRRHNHPTRATPQWGAPRVTRRSATLTPPTPYKPPVARSSLHTRRHSLSTHRHLRACKKAAPPAPPATCHVCAFKPSIPPPICTPMCDAQTRLRWPGTLPLPDWAARCMRARRV